MENKNIILLGILLLLIFAGGGTGIYFYIDSKKFKNKCKECGFDGCGNSCGTCKEGEKCSNNGQCYTPNCKGKKCGDDDGHGGKCVVPNCEGKNCDEDDGCGGVCGCTGGKRCNKGKCCLPT